MDQEAPLGLSRSADHRYTWRPTLEGSAAGPYPGATGILRTVDKSGPLVGWAKRAVAEVAVEKLGVLNEMVRTGGRDAAVTWLKGLPDYERDKAAGLGSAVHAFAEQIARGESILVTDAEGPYIESYRRFLDDRKPHFLAAEEMIFSQRWKYGGTLDAIAEIDGQIWLYDIKTSTGVYAETALQLAAYGFADFIGRTGTAKRYRIPRATRFGVVHVRPEGARLIDFTHSVNRDTFRVYLAARAVWEWQQGPAKTAVGQEVKREEAT